MAKVKKKPVPKKKAPKRFTVGEILAAVDKVDADLAQAQASRHVHGAVQQSVGMIRTAIKELDKADA